MSLQNPELESIGDEDVNETTYATLKLTQKKMGIGKIKLGACLCILIDSEGWKGRTGGNTPRQFMMEEGIEPRAARQYMAVARKFILELRINKVQLESICTASMRNLVRAAEIASQENLEVILEILSSLPRAEAAFELESLVPRLGTDVKNQELKPVNKILNQVDDLSFEQRSQLFMKLGMAKQTSAILE